MWNIVLGIWIQIFSVRGSIAIVNPIYLDIWTRYFPYAVLALKGCYNDGSAQRCARWAQRRAYWVYEFVVGDACVGASPLFPQSGFIYPITLHGGTNVDFWTFGRSLHARFTRVALVQH